MVDQREIVKNVMENKGSTWASDIEIRSDNEEFVPPDDKEMKQLLWKLDLRIIPWIGVLYLCSFLDRVNIGNARLAGLQTDLLMSDEDYSLALSIFFVGYVLFEVPSNVILKHVGPRLWIPIIMVSWGVCMCLMSQVKNKAGLITCRLFLGLTEAGLIPAVVFYLSMWFTRQEQASRISLFFSSSTMAGAFGGVLAFGIMQMNGIGNMTGWQWIFIIESIPTILLSIATYFILPDLPQHAKFLNEREREIVIQRLILDAGPSTETHFSWHQFRLAFTDWKVYMHSLILICSTTSVYSLSLYLPNIIKGMGYTDISAQVMSAPPYAVACFVTIVVAFHADKKRERGLHITALCLVSITGFLLLVVLRDSGAVAMYIASIIATTGNFAHIPIVLSWLNSLYGGHTKRGVAIAIVMSIGNTGGAIAGQVHRSEDAPYYTRGHEICLGLMSSSFFLSLLFKFLLDKENKRRDNLTAEERAYEASGEELCDLHPDFRYIS